MNFFKYLDGLLDNNVIDHKGWMERAFEFNRQPKRDKCVVNGTTVFIVDRRQQYAERLAAFGRYGQ